MSDGQAPEQEGLDEVATVLLGVLLPPMVRKSLWKALAALITGASEIPIGWLEDRARGRLRPGGVVWAQSGLSGRTALGTASDPALAERAAVFLENRLLREQANREAIAARVVDDIAGNPPGADTAATVSDDWLAALARLVEMRGEVDVQWLFARILAEEIRRPGSFSMPTLEVTSKLTAEMAGLFQRFCNASVGQVATPSVLTSPFPGNPGGNALARIGLPRLVLGRLQDAGLVQPGFDAHFTLTPAKFRVPFEVAGAWFQAGRTDTGAASTTAAAPVQIKVMNFTKAGLELRGVIPMTPHPEVVEKLATYLRRFDLELTRVGSGAGAAS